MEKKRKKKGKESNKLKTDSTPSVPISDPVCPCGNKQFKVYGPAESFSFSSALHRRQSIAIFRWSSWLFWMYLWHCHLLVLDPV